jgi:hypothetical protein
MRQIVRNLFAPLLVFLLIFSAPSFADMTGQLTLFPTEQQAQSHCPSDIVVWLNTPSGIYHFKGQRWYGATKSGAYVCEREADKVGDRPTRNGQ